MSTERSFDPIEALESLGLSNYESRVFVALQKLGTGTAKDVSGVAEVPRSQVYGAAESLESRGLIEIQQSTPKSYRPVPLEEAKSRLVERFETNRERAFEYLDRVKDEQASSAEEREGVWRLTGAAAIEGRMRQLIESASDRIVVGFNEGVEFSPELQELLSERAGSGVFVVVVDEDPDSVPDIEGVLVHGIPHNLRDSKQAGRLLIVDDDTVLMSVIDDEGEETAVWSARTGFARVLIPLVEDATLPEDDGNL